MTHTYIHFLQYVNGTWVPVVPPAPPPSYTLSTKVGLTLNLFLTDRRWSFHWIYCIGDRSNLSLPRVLRLDHREQFDYLHSWIFTHSQTTSLQPAPAPGSWDNIQFLGNQFWFFCHILSFRFRLGCVALLRRGWTSVWAQPTFSLRWRTYKGCLSPAFSCLSL